MDNTAPAKKCFGVMLGVALPAAGLVSFQLDPAIISF
jgi:hypothetical protein